MPDASLALLLKTAAVLAAVVVGFWVHLRWHPLREILAEAWQGLQCFSWWVPGAAGLIFVSSHFDPGQTLNGGQLALDGVGEVSGALHDFAQLQHTWVPAWPTGLLLAPFVLAGLWWGR